MQQTTKRIRNETVNFSSNPMVEQFDELLDCEGDVNVAGMQFAPSTILKNCDPIAYSIAVNEFIDNQIEDLRYDLERTEDEDEVADLNERIEELESYYIWPIWWRTKVLGCLEVDFLV